VLHLSQSATENQVQNVMVHRKALTAAETGSCSICIGWLSFMSHSIQNRSFQRRTS